MKLPLVLAILSLNAIAYAGGVSGRIVVEGEVPAAEPLPPGKDVCCQKAGPVDESVVVGPDGGLANVFVSVEPRRGEPQPPSEAPVADEPATLTNHGCAFSPRCPVRFEPCEREVPTLQPVGGTTDAFHQGACYHESTVLEAMVAR